MKVVGFIIGAALIVAGIYTGNVGLIIQGSAMIVTQAVVDLTMPKTPARTASEMTIALGEQPRVMLVGETFTPGSLVDGFNYGGKYGTDWEVLIIRLADHKCHSLTGFFVNDEFIPYIGDGNYAHFDGHHFSLWFRADTTNVPMPSVVLDNGPGWTAADVGESGCDVIVAYLSDKPDAKNPAWPGGRPRFGFVVKGAFCYDPRKDDTVTGGSGPHRYDDPATWEWSENAAICRYKWVRGVYANDDVSDPTKLLVGRGLTAEEAPPENIIAAANLCDEIAAVTHPYNLLDMIGTFAAYFSPDRTLLVTQAVTDFEVWHVPTRTRISGPVTLAVGAKPIAVNADGSFYTGRSGETTFTDGVTLVSPTGDRTVLSPDPMEGGVWQVTAGIFGRWHLNNNKVRQLLPELATVTETAVGFQPSWYFDDSALVSWAVGGVGSGTASFTTGIGFCQVPGGTPHIVATSTSGDAYAVDNGAGQFFVWQANTIYLIDPATWTIVAGPVTATSADADCPFRGVVTGDSSIWISFTRYSTLDLSVIETVDPTAWPSGTSAPSHAIYDRINDALWSDFILESVTTVRLLHRHGGYRVAGPIYANQEFLEVEGMFAAATAGNIVTREGSVELEPGQAKSIVATFTDADLVTGSQVSWNHRILSESNPEKVNTVVVRYVEPDQKWNDHAAPVLRVDADIIADGKPREASMTTRLIRYQAQALRVGEINRRLGRLWGRASVQLGPRFCELEDGDLVQWQSARYGFTITFRIEAYAIDEKFHIKLTLREIAGSVYADDASFPHDQSQPIRAPLPTPTGAPGGGDWTLTAVTLDSSGASVPALELTGATPADENAEAIIVEYWLSDGITDPTDDPDSIAWTMVGRYAPSTTKIDLTGLTGNATYYVAISYVVSGSTGDRLVLGPETVADLDVSGQVPSLDLTVETVTATTYTIAATVPDHATAAYPVGGRTRMTQAGAGQITLVAAPGVTLNSRGAALKSAGQMAVLEIEKIGTDEWDVLGDVTT
jgi:hypothetical protein